MLSNPTSIERVGDDVYVLDKDKKLIKSLSVDDCRRLIADGTATGGMIPKIETCIYAIERGVEGVVIMDGKVPHAVLLELLTNHGAGTLITEDFQDGRPLGGVTFIDPFRAGNAARLERALR
mgnify:CR=1 FL=1